MTAADGPAAGQVVGGRYELLEPLGKGGMGEVWVGRDTALGSRKVAVKLLQAGRLASLSGTDDQAELRRRFLRECRVTARIDHPGLVAVHDAGGEDDQLYLVMQLVEGSDLAAHLAERPHGGAPYPGVWAAAVLAQLSSVLVSVHAVGIIHRDLKPGNIILRPDGRLTILDLGIAAVQESEDTRLTRTGMLIGTPLYMAPEQALGGSPVGPPADLYALGSIGYELLTGRPPFEARDAGGLLYKKMHQPPESLRTLRPDIPAALAVLIMRLLDPEPERRPADARELYGALAPLLPRSGGSEESAARPMDPTRPYLHPMVPWPPPPRTGPGLPVLVEKAKSLLSAGRSAPAADLLYQALPLAAAEYGEGSTVFRTLRKQYAAALLDTGAYGRALPEIQWLLREFAAERGPYDPLVAQLRQDEQMCLRAVGHGMR